MTEPVKSDNMMTFEFFEQYVLIKLAGKLSPERILQVTSDVIYSANWSPGFSMIWDATLTDFSGLVEPSIYITGSILKKLSKAERSSSIALVSENTAHHDSFALFSEYYDIGIDEIEVFASVDEAMKWILGENNS